MIDAVERADAGVDRFGQCQPAHILTNIGDLTVFLKRPSRRFREHIKAAVDAEHLYPTRKQLP